MIHAMDDPTERLDLVDANDTLMGVIDRQEVLDLETSKRGYVRAVGVFLMNNQGQLWVPRRSEHKKIAPGGLDFSAGEHVGAGETYKAAALRGLQEELNISPDDSLLVLTGKVSPFPGMPYFHEIFVYNSDDEPSYNAQDYSGYAWLTPEELASKLEAGEPAKEILLPSVQLILHNQPIIGANQ